MGVDERTYLFCPRVVSRVARKQITSAPVMASQRIMQKKKFFDPLTTRFPSGEKATETTP